MSLSQLKAATNSQEFDLKQLNVKKSIVGRSQYARTSPYALGTYGTELFSKKKQKFPVRRLYISDIPIEATEEDVSQVFNGIGLVIEVEMSETNDNEETKSMFLTFQESKHAIAAIVSKDTKVQGRIVTACEAVPKKSQIFVGGLKPETDEDDLIGFFTNFGHVCEAVLKTDNRTGLSRCFGFITFVDSAPAVKELLKNRFIEMYGKRIEVKPAVPMNQQNRMKRAQMAAALSVASDQVNAVHKLTGGNRGTNSMSMSMESPIMQQAYANRNSYSYEGMPMYSPSHMNRSQEYGYRSPYARYNNMNNQYF